MAESIDVLKAAAGGYYQSATAHTFFEAFGRRETIAAGTVLFEEHEKSNKQGLFAKPLNQALATPINQDLFARRNIHRMFFLTEGTVELTAGGRLLETVWPGDVFGEMALIDHAPRTATVTAKTDCRLVPIDEPRFLNHVHRTPFFALQVMRIMNERLRRRMSDAG